MTLAKPTPRTPTTSAPARRKRPKIEATEPRAPFLEAGEYVLEWLSSEAGKPQGASHRTCKITFRVISAVPGSTHAVGDIVVWCQILDGRAEEYSKSRLKSAALAFRGWDSEDSETEDPDDTMTYALCGEDDDDLGHFAALTGMRAAARVIKGKPIKPREDDSQAEDSETKYYSDVFWEAIAE
jgi:hypothetical protein